MKKTAFGSLSNASHRVRNAVRLPDKLWQIMRLTTIMLLAFFLQLSAKTMSQTITVSLKNAPMKEVISVIRKQTGYYLFYKNELLKDSKPVSITATNQSLTTFLDYVVKGQGLSYRITDKTIMLFKKTDDQVSDLLLNNYSETQTAGVKVRGIVLSEGKAVERGTVMLKPLNKGTLTDANGQFEFSDIAPGKYTVVISCIGFKPVATDITVSDKPVFLNPLMEKAANAIQEVLVSTGYSTKKAGEITGSMQRISGDELRTGITTSDPASLLKGRVTGLYISEQNAGDPTSSGGQIFVRGQSSIAGVGVDQANQAVMPNLNYGPLLVVDGVIMPNQNLKEVVTPQEIDEVTILKDAAATAIYGSRAAAGVIVITTKKGKPGQPRVSAEVKYGINAPNRGSVSFMNGQQLYDLQKEYFTQDYQVNKASLTARYPTLQNYLDYQLPSTNDVAHSYDWQKYAFLNTNTKEVNVSASGGNDNTRYFIGAGYYNEQSTGVDNGLVRKSIRLNLQSKLSSRLTANIGINAVLNNGHREYMNSGTFLYQLIPWANPYNDNGSLKSALNYKLFGSQQTAANPLYDNQWNYDKPTSQLLFGSARLAYKITDWLDLTSTNSGNLNYYKEELYADVRSYAGSADVVAPQGFLGTQTNNLTSYLTSNQLNFHKHFDDHSISALVGMEYGKTTNNNTVVNVNHVQAGFPQISLGTQIGGSYDYSAYGVPPSKTGNIEGGQIDQAIYSLFGEADYTYRNRYSVSGSIRRDASSAFGADRRYGTFYSAGAAWILSNESFMKNVKAVTNLKWRGNYGTSGSQLGDNFLTSTLYRPGSAFIYGGTPGVGLSNIANPDLRWEVTKTLSTGLDIGLFGRINATIDAYSRRSENLLQQVALPAVAGFPNQWQNIGVVRNSGVEVLVNADIIRRKNFTWNAAVNFSYNQNKIISVANDSLKQGFYQGESFYLRPGDDINALKAVKYAGVDPETGKPQFEKKIFDADGHQTGVQLVNTLNEVGQAVDSRQMQTVGSFQPKYYGGVTNTFTYKQFSLNVLITYTLKFVMKDVLAEQMQAGTFMSSFNQVNFLKGQRLWTHPGQTDATEPWLYYQVKTNYDGSDKYIHDASNVRLRSVRLSYTLAQDLMKRAHLTSCTVYVSGDNLYTWYSKKIVTSDPEGPSVGNSQDFGNSIGSSIGVPRRYVFGVQVNF
ncbi:SusC/RagA family TonB-linked outer membrane protein [Chitinophaga arvensicola]|uniref:TonB-linked outer membrane protein, SusC/RagA family n=1 Tax=Chitinophaga arvensicola TaxID=29529 RepID=A0A1I0PYQ6_9BACT|nr:SusC/RagA family TonB-linked outer membrane protein [Chitinophaga arvensicola]SEW19585.1 TonB-linked outer membrane protein, SusC/RagA family [Chitinophaga arvensicola]